VKRTCILIESSKAHKRHLCVDVHIADEFFEFINTDENHHKKYQEIVDHILEERNIYFEHYGKEGYNAKTRHVAAMKFFKGGKNTRVYCVEQKTPEGVFYIIAAKFLPKKKVQKNNKVINGFIKTISDYEYEIITQ
jgi:hypothetical protein